MVAGQSSKYFNYYLSAAHEREISTKTLDIIALDEVLAEQRLFLATQPVRAADGADGAGVTLYSECLARLRDRDGTVWRADQFLPALKRSHSLPLLDRHVLALILDGLDADAGAVLGCNLSAESFAEEAVWNGILEQLLGRSHLLPRLVLELTETQALDDPSLAQRRIVEIRRRGCRVAMDDFGVAFASPRLVQLIDFDIIKIDKSFIRDVRPSAGGQDSLRHMVGFALSFAPTVIVEGIETAEQARYASAAGATHLQGYHIAALDSLGVAGGPA